MSSQKALGLREGALSQAKPLLIVSKRARIESRAREFQGEALTFRLIGILRERVILCSKEDGSYIRGDQEGAYSLVDLEQVPNSV